MDMEKILALRKNYFILYNEADESDPGDLIYKRSMMEESGEKERLIRQSTDSSEIMSFKNTNHKSAEELENSLASALNLINEQAEKLESYKQRVKDEEEKNKELLLKVESLSSDLSHLKGLHEEEIEQRNTDIKNLRNALEVQKELQASTIDEVKFQVNSLRNKMDRGITKNISEGKPPSSPTKMSASVDSSPQLRRHVEPHLVCRNSSDDGIFNGSSPCLLSHTNAVQRAEVIWRINAFSKKLRKIRSGSYDDPSRGEPFTTGAYGYRLSLWAYLNGRGKGDGTHLSLYVRVMAGEFDPILSWPIRPCYTFYLISQNQDANKRFDLVRVRDLSLKHQSSISRPTKDDKTIIVGFDDFVLHEDLEKKGFLEDDSLFVKCVVEIPSVSS